MPGRSRPEPFSAFTTLDLWNDPHISQQMLAAHLDPHSPMASRTHAFIDSSVEWLVGMLALTPGSRVLDLGCGPGLYAHRLARRGIRVLGIDASDRSVASATEVADQEGLAAQFRRGDYLRDDLGQGHDAAILIYEDYSVLSPTQRGLLLRRVAAALGPRGRIVFDVTSTARFASFRESIVTEPNLMGGFWSADPYVGTRETWTYPEQSLVLEKYTIETAHASREFWNWMHCLDPETVTRELAENGFRAPALYGDVTGAAYDEASPVFAECAERA